MYIFTSISVQAEGSWDGTGICSISWERREKERESERKESQNKKKLGYSKHFGVFSL
jgi:hypothetical protein